MNIFERLLYFLQAEMVRPHGFGWFHLLSIFIAFFSIGILCYQKKYNQKKLKIVLGTYGFIALILEILKQLIWAMEYNPTLNLVTWDYDWYSFPFQLCTTPIYVTCLCYFLKKNKLRDYLLSYVAYITILGSIATIIMPDTCFVSDILINIQTMWMHLGSFVVSVYLLISREVKINKKSLQKAIITFIGFVLFANLLNIFVYNLGVLNGETFNMFYISPYFISELPIFNIIQENVPYIIFFIIYILALSLGGTIIYYIANFCKFLFAKKRN